MGKEKRERPIQKKVRFNQKEFEYIRKRIEQSPFNDFQNYARILLITGEITVVDYSELERLNREVNRIGTNINQMAKLA
ncbi:TPA: plasmid mobilization relaxosome protein MobC, partial [Enterococcus faecalis]|nr:plasmid mobilization relaxosome protein MobC [Enterococcus faecalis]